MSKLKTLTKKQLISMLSVVDDDAEISLTFDSLTLREAENKGLALDVVENRKMYFLGLAGDCIPDTDGVALILCAETKSFDVFQKDQLKAIADFDGNFEQLTNIETK